MALSSAIGLTVQDVRAQVSLNANAMNFVQITAGVDARPQPAILTQVLTAVDTTVNAATAPLTRTGRGAPQD